MQELSEGAPAAEPAASWTHPKSGKQFVSGSDNTSLPMLVPFDKLSDADKGTSVAMKHCVEGSLDQAMANARWVPDANFKVVQREFLGDIPALIRGPISAFVRANVLKQFWGKGFMRHSRQDQLELAGEDFAAVASLLKCGKAAWADSQHEDKHPRMWFALGVHPSMLDSVVFAFMDSMLNDSAFDTPWPSMIKEHDVIVEYVTMFREQYFAL